MIRLKVETEARWLELNVVTGRDAKGKDVTNLVRVQVQPRTSVMDGAAAAQAARRIRAELEEADASGAAGMPLDPDGFNAKNTDVLNAKFNQYQLEALAQFGIIAWEGIADDSGQPLPVNAATTLAFASVPAIATAFSNAYSGSAALVDAEGNGSAPYLKWRYSGSGKACAGCTRRPGSASDGAGRRFCAVCPSSVNQPETGDGLLVLQSVETAVQPGFWGPVLDTGSALTLSVARGVDAAVAAVLIGFAASGILEGIVAGRG